MTPLRVTIVVESILLMALYYTRYKRELWYTIPTKFWYNKQTICSIFLTLIADIQTQTYVEPLDTF